MNWFYLYFKLKCKFTFCRGVVVKRYRRISTINSYHNGNTNRLFTSEKSNWPKLVPNKRCQIFSHWCKHYKSIILSTTIKILFHNLKHQMILVFVYGRNTVSVTMSPYVPRIFWNVFICTPPPSLKFHYPMTEFSYSEYFSDKYFFKYFTYSLMGRGGGVGSGTNRSPTYISTNYLSE